VNNRIINLLVKVVQTIANPLDYFVTPVPIKFRGSICICYQRRAYHIKPVVTDAVNVVYCIKSRAAAGEESMREKNSKTARGH
jgi:hypothetical protein